MRPTQNSIDLETTPRPVKSTDSRKKGRPSNAMSGDVDVRILDAATAIFLQHGFAGTSIDRIAESAGAGKATLYSRYSGKEALFSEVVKRNCQRSLRLVYETLPSASLAKRLASVTQTLVTRLLSDDVIGLLRMVVADATRFPALAKLTSDTGRSLALDMVATLLEGHSKDAINDPENAARKHHSRALAAQLVETVISPMLIRALMGEDLAEVRSDTRCHVKNMIAIFVAAKELDPFL